MDAFPLLAGFHVLEGMMMLTGEETLSTIVSLNCEPSVLRFKLSGKTSPLLPQYHNCHGANKLF